MKKYILFFLCITVLLSCDVNSSDDSLRNEEQYSKEVIDFFDTVYEYYSFYNDSLGWQKDFSKQEIDLLAEKYFVVNYHFPADFFLYHKEVYKEWEKEVKNYGYNNVQKRPAIILRIIREKISEFYSDSFSEILQVPYLMRVKLVRFEKSIYFAEPDSMIVPQYDMEMYVEEILKGSDYFSVNDTITVSYFSHWFHGATENQRFEIDSTYFLPVDLFRIEDKNTYQYKIRMLPDFNYAIYPIIHSEVITPGNYFGVGEKTEWEVFKEYIKEKYLF
jgi:hypothetical protein